MQAKKDSLNHEPMEFFTQHAEDDIKRDDREEERTEKTLGKKFLAGEEKGEKGPDGSLLSHINKSVEEKFALDEWFDNLQ